MEQRLQKALAAAGVGSRRKCEELIAAGRVSIDGEIVTEMGLKVDAKKSVVTVDGRPVKPPPENVYIVLNKPRGYTSTRRDPHAKHTVMELLRDAPAPVYPVGRLDVDSEGLLILTNDGDFTHHLTHPSHEVPKTYVADVRGRLSYLDLRALAEGVMLEDGKTAPAEARVLSYDRRTAVNRIELTIHEGRKRQVRRMFDAINHPLQRLVRTRIGSLTSDELEPGQWRPLTSREVSSLLRSVQPRPRQTRRPGRSLRSRA
ncbi:MAG: pseudouridine synthase [Armatimonadota bacterium]|nr:pseudouridine synthase [Armatimonadota bacterium]